MMIFKNKVDLQKTLEAISAYEGKDLDLLADLVHAIRPTNGDVLKERVPQFDRLIFLLQSQTNYKIGLREYLNRLLLGKQLSSSLTDANIITGLDFFSELRKRLVHKFLPYQPEKNTVEHILVNVFYHSIDGKWILQIPNEKCKLLLNVLEVDGFFERNVQSPFIQDILFAIRVITHRLTGIAFDFEVLRMVPEYHCKESPFAALQDEIDNFLKGLNTGLFNRSNQEINFKQIHVLIGQCHEFINTAYKNKSKFGISFQLHQQLMVIITLLGRLSIILDSFVKHDEEDSKTELAKFIKSIIFINSGKAEITGYLNKATQIMAHEITQNTGKAGEHYITSNQKDYKSMLSSAIGGGAIVAFACVAKMELASMHSSIFGQGLLYSINYATAFILIYLLHYTLATKQPAMTAATLAKEVESDLKLNNNYLNLAQLFSRIFRSQFIAFVGNVFMAFPVAMALMFIWGTLFDVNLAAHKAPTFIKDLNLLKSPLIFHSAIAGIFLFISGLIAGMVHNKTKYKRVPERIVQHPALKRLLSLNSRQNLAKFYENNISGIASNLWFGIFLGFIHPVGEILGLNLDIRHITFAAGNFALGLYGQGFSLSLETILMSILGIGVIGFVNFMVSFTLSLLVALRSRGIPLNALWKILIAIKNRFISRPASFFFPPREIS
ncbi:MAG: recombinase [bacterium]|nr:recombinase [bacterium]